MYQHNYDKGKLIEAAIKNNVDALMWVKTGTGNENLKYIRMALDISPRALFFVQFKTYAICEYAIRKHPESIVHVPPALKNFKFLTSLCTNDAFQKMDEAVFPDLNYTEDEVVQLYRKGCWAAIKFYRGKNSMLYEELLRFYPDVIYHLTRFNFITLNSLLKGDRKGAVEGALLEGIKKSGKSLLFNELIKARLTNLSDDFFMSIVKIDPNTITMIPVERYNSDLLRRAVRTDPSVLRFIPSGYQTKELVSEALQADGLAIQFVKSDMTAKMVKQAVINNIYALNYIEDPDFPLFDLALRTSPDAFVFLKLRTKKFIEFCQLHSIDIPDTAETDAQMNDNDIDALVKESRQGRENDPNLLTDHDINEIINQIPEDLFS